MSRHPLAFLYLPLHPAAMGAVLSIDHGVQSESFVHFRCVRFGAHWGVGKANFEVLEFVTSNFEVTKTLGSREFVSQKFEPLPLFPGSFGVLNFGTSIFFFRMGIPLVIELFDNDAIMLRMG